MGGIAFELRLPRGGPAESADEASASQAVSTMLRAMRHRGLDGARRVARADDRGSVALGYAATWVLDDDVGSVQPLVQPIDGGELLLAFDGRVDDRASTAASLGARNGGPDAALAAAAVVRFGVRAATRLLGEMAFVAHARGARGDVTWIVPDRLGVVPLYYRWSTNSAFRTEAIGTAPVALRRLRVASEKQALFADATTPPVDRTELSLALAEEHTERDATLYEGIRRIPPGHLLVVEQGCARIERYFDLDVERRLEVRDPRDASAWLRAVLVDAIRDRSRARRGFSATVSGGIDSTTIAALATHEARAHRAVAPRLVTVRYADRETDETFESRALARHLGLPLEIVDVPTGPDAFSPTSAGVTLEALWDPYTFLLRGMLEGADGRRGIALGFGGDEIQRNTGYEVGQSLAEGELVSAVRWAGPMTERWAVRRLVSTAIRFGARRLRPHPPFVAPTFLTRDALRAVDVRRAEIAARRPTGASLATRAQHELFTEGAAAPFSIAHAAHVAAELGVVFLQPYFDVRVVELTLALPLHVRPDPFSLKPLLRRITEDVCPPEIARRTARADFMPFYRRVLFDQRASLEALLRNERLASLGLVEQTDATRVLEASMQRPERIREAMTLVTYEAWLALLAARRPEPTMREAGSPEPLNASGDPCIVW